MRVMIVFALAMLIGCQTSGPVTTDMGGSSEISGGLEFVSGRYDPAILYSDGICKIVSVHRVELETRSGRAPWSHPDSQGMIKFEIVGGKSVHVGMGGKYIGRIKSNVKIDKPNMIVDLDISTVVGMCKLVFEVAGAFDN